MKGKGITLTQLLTSKNDRPLGSHFLHEVRQKIDKNGRAEIFKIREEVEKEEKNVNSGKASRGINHSNCPECLEFLDGVEKNARSIVLVTTKKAILKDNNDFEIVSKPLKDRVVNAKHPISDNSAYANQHSFISLGSGGFVAERIKDGKKTWIVVTAAHVVIRPSLKIQDLRFVQDLRLLKNIDPNKKWSNMDENKIFKPVDNVDETNFLSPLNYKLSSFGADWALIEVECIGQTPSVRTVKASTKKINLEDEVYAIGFVLGLPMKPSFGGKIIRDSNSKPYFECSSSFGGGDSGTLLFDSKTHEWIGIHIRGTNKWELLDDNGKNKLFLKDETQIVEGQECQRLEPILSRLNDLK